MLAIGIASMLSFCFPILGVGLGVGAIAMANNDLREMADGAIDRRGRAATTGGMVGGILGIVLSALGFLLGLVFTVASNHQR
jgi:uncharacterized membrane protein